MLQFLNLLMASFKYCWCMHIGLIKDVRNGNFTVRTVHCLEMFANIIKCDREPIAILKK